MSRTTRRPYRGSRAIDPSCRSHGGCPWCAGKRKYKERKAEEKADCEVVEAERVLGEIPSAPGIPQELDGSAKSCGLQCKLSDPRSQFWSAFLTGLVRPDRTEAVNPHQPALHRFLLVASR